MIINEITELKPPRPIFVEHGRNMYKGKEQGEIGKVFYKKNYPPYLFIEKTPKQIFRRPDLRRIAWISHDGLEKALEYGAKIIIFHFIGYEEGRSFFVVYDVNEFVKSKRIINFDDCQKGVPLDKKPRFYEFPPSHNLWNFVGSKNEKI